MHFKPALSFDHRSSLGTTYGSAGHIISCVLQPCQQRYLFSQPDWRDMLSDGHDPSSLSHFITARGIISLVLCFILNQSTRGTYSGVRSLISILDDDHIRQDIRLGQASVIDFPVHSVLYPVSWFFLLDIILQTSTPFLYSVLS